MKGIYRDIILTIILAIIVPMLLFASLPAKEETAVPATEIEEQPESQTVMLLHANGTVEELPMQDYILQVVLKEMPASFEPEALKAQCVVVRTYAMKREMDNPKHPEAALCTDPQCCQGYCSVEDYLMQGGSYADVVKIQKAVNETLGEVITYQNELIDATYFSCSGGITEDAQAVWGEEIPYLRSVESPGEESAAYFTDSVTFPVDDFQFLLGQDLTGRPETWIDNVTYTQGNGVDTITLQGVSYSGTAFRKKLGLRSTCFQISITDTFVTVTTKGYGHRVGMSQYGADAMAVSGKNYQEILKYYYTGTEITTYSHSD